MRLPAYIFLLAAASPVTAAELKSLHLERQTLVGGDPLYGAVVMSAKTEKDESIALVDNTSAIQTPSSVGVALNRDNATFVCSTSVVSSPAPRTLTASLRAVSRTAHVTLVPPPTLDRVEVVPAEVVGGENFSLNAWLTTVAPIGGCTLSLASQSAAISVPSSLSVIEAAPVGSVQGSTSNVTAIYNRTVSASFAGVTKFATLVVHPPQKLLWVKVSKTILTHQEVTQITFELGGHAPAAGSIVVVDYPDGFLSGTWSSTKRFGKIELSAAQVTVATPFTLIVFAGGVQKATSMLLLPPL